MERPDGGSFADAGDPEAGAAPAPVDADVRGPRVVCRLDERACDHRRAGDTPPTLTLTPWTPRGAAATYVAWKLGDCGGHFAVFDATRERLLLGEGTPAGRRWHPVVDVGPAGEHLAGSTPELRPSVPRAEATTLDGPTLDPKPGDAAEWGETRAFTLDSWTRPVRAYVQPWRPLNGGAVYVACRIDDPHDRFSYHGWFGTLSQSVLRLGRRPAPAFVAVKFAADTGLTADVATLVPDRTPPLRVGEVVSVAAGGDDGRN